MKNYFLSAGSALTLMFWAFTASAFSFDVPQKYADAKLTRPVMNEHRFTEAQVVEREFVRLKKAEWSACRQDEEQRNSLFFSADTQSLSKFLETQNIVNNLEAMEKKDLLEGQVEVQPWSGDYWSYAKGILGGRYFDPQYMNLHDWLARFDFITQNPSSHILLQQGEEGLKILSPSEKYDLIVGDSKFALTASMWAQGKQYQDQYGEVESWMGICHGWAPAAMMEPRPKSSVTVKSFDEKWNILLKPAEIKGLISYNWATNNFASAFLGNRCNKKNPKRDENGRIIDPECFDLNPAIWHIAVVNQLGMGKRSLIMDASYDYEVWNQPLLSYSYTYFNVLTKEPEIDFESAVVERESYTDDPFKKYRSPQTKSIVGISMTVGYVVETVVNDSELDSPEQDEIRYVNYNYELELDGKGKIIGGEWNQIAHPDFIWTPLKSTHPLSFADRMISLSDWNLPSTLPKNWSESAKSISASGQVLSAITTVIGRKAAE